jgi:hypothetical protein
VKARGRFIFVGPHNRFVIERRDDDFQVRDAHMVTDAEVRAGKRSPIVATFNTLPEAKTFCGRAA